MEAPSTFVGVHMDIYGIFMEVPCTFVEVDDFYGSRNSIKVFMNVQETFMKFHGGLNKKFHARVGNRSWNLHRITWNLHETPMNPHERP